MISKLRNKKVLPLLAAIPQQPNQIWMLKLVQNPYFCLGQRGELRRIFESFLASEWTDTRPARAALTAQKMSPQTSGERVACLKRPTSSISAQHKVLLVGFPLLQAHEKEETNSLKKTCIFAIRPVSVLGLWK